MPYSTLSRPTPSGPTTLAWSMRMAAVLFAFSLLSLAKGASAYGFTLTDREFAGWPRWCQELYVATGVGRTTQFATRISPDAAQRAAKNPQLNGFWHYCAGMVWLERARAEPDPGRADYMYRKTIDETSFNYALTPSGHFLRGDMGATLGLAYRGVREYDKAMEFLEKAIREEPAHPQSYTAMYLVLRDLGRNDEAREILIRGNEATKGKSAELHYFLGLAYVDAGDAASARKHADQAYRLGYPLPGLKNKLDRLEAANRAKTE